MLEAIGGGLAVDDRGSLTFFNDFDFVARNIRRSYVVKNHSNLFVRAWHGHKNETKYVTVLSGTAVIKTVKMVEVEYFTRDMDLIAEQVDEENMDWDESADAINARFEKLDISSQVLTAEKPTILTIPDGYYNGFLNLTKNTIVQFFSDKTLEESKDDDFRMDWDYFGPDVWMVNFR